MPKIKPPFDSASSEMSAVSKAALAVCTVIAAASAAHLSNHWEEAKGLFTQDTVASFGCEMMYGDGAVAIAADVCSLMRDEKPKTTVKGQQLTR